MQEKFFKKDEFIYKPGDTNLFLYKIIKGKVFTFKLQGSKINPIWETIPGSFAGTNSFFLKKPSTTYSVATEDTTVYIYTQEEFDAYFPNWLKILARSIATKTEDEILQIIQRGVKRDTKTIKPLSIDEQRHYLQLLKLV